MVIGIVLWAVSRAFTGTVARVTYYLGIALVVIGIIVIVVALLIGAIGSPGWDIDALIYQAKSLL